MKFLFSQVDEKTLKAHFSASEMAVLETTLSNDAAFGVSLCDIYSIKKVIRNKDETPNFVLKDEFFYTSSQKNKSFSNSVTISKIIIAVFKALQNEVGTIDFKKENSNLLTTYPTGHLFRLIANVVFLQEDSHGRTISINEYFKNNTSCAWISQHLTNQEKNPVLLMMVIWLFYQYRSINNESLTMETFLQANSTEYQQVMKDDFRVLQNKILKSEDSTIKKILHKGNYAANLLTIDRRVIDSAKENQTPRIKDSDYAFTAFVHGINLGLKLREESSVTAYEIAVKLAARRGDSQTPLNAPLIAMYEIKKQYFNNKDISTVYDPYSGWGGRLTIFMAIAPKLGIKNIIYNDLNSNLIERYKLMHDLFNTVLVEAEPNNTVRAHYHNLDAAVVPIADKSVSVVYTSPPYVNYMLYQGNHTTAQTLIKGIAHTFDKLIEGGIACFTVDENTYNVLKKEFHEKHRPGIRFCKNIEYDQSVNAGHAVKQFSMVFKHLDPLMTIKINLDSIRDAENKSKEKRKLVLEQTCAKKFKKEASESLAEFDNALSTLGFFADTSGNTNASISTRTSNTPKNKS